MLLTSQGGWALLFLHVGCGARLVDSDAILVSRVQLAPSAMEAAGSQVLLPRDWLLAARLPRAPYGIHADLGAGTGSRMPRAVLGTQHLDSFRRLLRQGTQSCGELSFQTVGVSMAARTVRPHGSCGTEACGQRCGESFQKPKRIPLSTEARLSACGCLQALMLYGRGCRYFDMVTSVAFMLGNPSFNPTAVTLRALPASHPRP